MLRFARSSNSYFSAASAITRRIASDQHRNHVFCRSLSIWSWAFEDSSKRNPEDESTKDENSNNHNNNQSGKNKCKSDEVIVDDHESSSSSSSSSENGGNGIRPFGADVPRPSSVLTLPLLRRPMFPGLLQPIRIRETDIVEALRDAHKKGSPYVGVFYRNPINVPSFSSTTSSSSASNEESESSLVISDLDQISKVGTLAQVFSMHRIPGARAGDEAEVQAFLMGHRRIIAKSIVQSSPFTIVDVEHFDEKSLAEQSHMDPDSVKAYRLEIIATIKEILTLNPLFKEQLQTLMATVDTNNPGLLADLASSLTSAEGVDLQDVLECFDVKERLAKALVLLKKELEISRLQSQISKQVEASVVASQRKFLLNEQLKSIKKELGLEKDDKETLITKFDQRLEQVHPPEAVLKVIAEEKDKIAHLESSSSEFNVTRNYLDWLTTVPWGIYSEESFDIQRTQAVLDEDHYGLTDVKNRILEFVAVGNLLGQAPQGRILCLVGPPGVGKTSIGRSIARALDRKFYRFSVGGLSDVAEIKGHRRTYVGAMPGKLIQCLKSTQTSNPVVLIDEIDKLSRGVQGDPASALLEVLDPEQNLSFMDHYLDVPVDLSKILFICTANEESAIPRALADRIEFIRLSGYIHDEKVEIARRYLSAEARRRTGVDDDSVVLRQDALDALIRMYCREAGVRDLEKKIEQIYRKAALRLVKDESVKQIVIDEENLSEFVGQPVFLSDRLYDELPAGVVTGLAWTSMGGSVLYIESACVPTTKEKSGLKITGHLGDVMKESSTIAESVARRILNEIDPHNDFFDRTLVHLHVPEGATPKEGPSAGITMVSALVSLATGRPVRSDLAMTGEVSLTGKVLKIGGVKEKTIAARRTGIHSLIFPETNRADFEALPDNIQEGLTVYFCKTYDEVFAHAFPAQTEAEVTSTTTDTLPESRSATD